MKKTLFTLLIAALFGGLFTVTSPSFAITYKEQYCAKTDQKFMDDAILPQNRLAFGNQAGSLKMGLCWWHSRFERAALYLTIFMPNSPAPTYEKAIELIHKIMTRKSIVVIPGFKNLREFSEAYKFEIVAEQNAWQIRDGFLNQYWIKGLVGKSELNKDDLKVHMNKIFEVFQKKKRVLSVILQQPGFDVHMWNITKMKKTETGYQLIVTDSNNYPGYFNDYYTVQYKYGDTHLGAASIVGGKEVEKLTDAVFVPYLSMNNLDLGRIDQTRSEYCKK